MAMADLASLDNILFRLSLTGEEALGPVVGRLLTRVLPLLDSPDEAVRKKVTEILVHVNQRIKSRHDIPLPVDELLNQFTSGQGSVLRRNTTLLVYIRLAVEHHMTAVDRGVLVPRLLASISQRSPTHRDALLHMALLGLAEITPTTDLPFIHDEADRRMVLAFLQDYLLLPADGERRLASEDPTLIPPGHSREALRCVVGKGIPASDVLAQQKVSVVRFLAHESFSSEEVFPHLLIASCDTHIVATEAEDKLRRLAKPDLENGRMIRCLFALMQGVPDTQRTPASPVVRAKVLPFLSRSVMAANSFPMAVQVVLGCIFGETTTQRLKQLGMEFTVWLFRHASEEGLRPICPVLFMKLQDLLDSLAEEREGPSRDEMKSFAYKAVAMLARRYPDLLQRDGSLLTRRFFHAITCETPTLRMAVREALGTLAEAYEVLPDTVRDSLVDMLLDSMLNADQQARVCAVQWAVRLFPFSHSPSRYICLLGVNDTKNEVKDEARKGLRPLQERDSTARYPEFRTCVHFMVDKVQVLQSIPSNRTSFDRSKVYADAIAFLQRCLDASTTHPGLTSSQYVHHLATQEDPSSVDSYRRFIENALTPQAPADLVTAAARALHALVALDTPLLAPMYSNRLLWLISHLQSVQSGAREAMGKVIAAASSVLEFAQVVTLVHELVASVEDSGKSLELRHGSALALGEVLAQGRRDTRVSSALLTESLSCLLSCVDSSNVLLQTAGCQSIGTIGQEGALEGCDVDPNAITDKLVRCLSSSATRVIERSIIALGQLGIGQRDVTFHATLVDAVFSVVTLKHEEVHFTAGEALTWIGGGRPNTPPDDVGVTTMTRILDRVMEIYLKDTRPLVRRAGCIWLLSLVRYTGTHPTVQRRLREIQDAFVALLADSEEITQEIASKGLSFLYDLGDETMKNDLVAGFVHTLTGGGRKPPRLEGEAQPVGTSPSGLSTYQELYALANEMGQPGLIYKLMDLTTHHAIWNSRKGTAFGFTSVASRAGDQLRPHLPTLVPKLYRYQYDPNERIRSAMEQIWGALVLDSRTMVNEYFAPILHELLDHMGSRLWRVREACFRALADLVQGRHMSDVAENLEVMWVMVFRGLDDIKETVRTAALISARSLASLSVRLCDHEHTSGSDGKKAVEIVLRVLLEKGIVSNVPEVRSFSLQNLLKVTERAGEWLRPHIPEMVTFLLESLSSMEPSFYSYLQLHVEKFDMQEEDLEGVRVSASRNTAISDTLERCSRLVDAENLPLLVSRLTTLVRHGVGLPTRVGTSRFIVGLCTQFPADIRGHTTSLLKALRPALLDPSATVRRAFATALACVAKLSKPKQLDTLISGLVTLYMESETDQTVHRSVSGVAMRELARHAIDQLRDFNGSVLPLTFLAQHDTDEEIQKIWQDVWEELVVDASSSLRLFLSEVIECLRAALLSSSWTMRQAGALAAAALVERVGGSTDVEGSEIAPALLSSLLTVLRGRMFKGKEAVLSALSTLVMKEATNLSSTVEDVLHSVKRECSRGPKSYRHAAVLALGKIVSSFRDRDLYAFVRDALVPLLSLGNETGTGKGKEPLHGKNNTHEDEDEDESLDRGKLRAAVFRSLGRAWPCACDTQRSHAASLWSLFVDGLRQRTPVEQIAILEAQSEFLERLDPSVKGDLVTRAMIEAWLPLLSECLSDTRSSSKRLAGLRVIDSFIRVFEGSPYDPLLQDLVTRLQADPDAEVQRLAITVQQATIK